MLKLTKEQNAFIAKEMGIAYGSSFDVMSLDLETVAGECIDIICDEHYLEEANDPKHDRGRMFMAENILGILNQ